MIDTIIPYYTDEKGKMCAFTRGSVKQASKQLRPSGYDSLSDYFVAIITGTFDQDVSTLVVGNKGTGKSASVLSISYHCAVKIAQIINDGSKWTDYYNLEEFTACILESEANRLMNVQKKYIIKNFDDISLGWNSRSWRDEENQMKNDVFTINRTDSCVQFFSVPNQFMLDKVPRSLVSHYIEMDEKYFEHGFTTIKMFKPKTLFREGRIINPFLSVDQKKYVNYAIPQPPHQLWQEYKLLRAKNKDIAIRLRTEQLKESGKVKSGGKTKSDKKRDEWKSWLSMASTDIYRVLQEKNCSVDKALSQIAKTQGQTAGAIQYLRRSGEIDKYGFRSTKQ